MSRAHLNLVSKEKEQKTHFFSSGFVSLSANEFGFLDPIENIIIP